MDQKNFYDVVVVGGGPAGLTAAIYLARARYRVIVVEQEKFGGQITITSDIVNYPGIASVSGSELTETMRRQAQSFGAEFMLAKVESLDLSEDIKKVSTSRGELSCFGVLIATGSSPRSVGFKGEQDFKGHGVAYCATCDGEFFTGREVFVIGGGFAAAEEGLFLTKYAKHVTILIRKDDFSCARSTADAARASEKITVITNTSVESVEGESAITKVTCVNNKTGDKTIYEADKGDFFGVFVFAGYEPATALIKDIVPLNAQGYVEVNSRQETGVPGLYAAGDVCEKNLRQVATAVGDGAAAATELEKYAASMQKKTGLVPTPPEPVPKAPVSKEKPAEKAPAQTSSDSIITPDMAAQLAPVFERMAQPLVLKVYPDDRTVSKELTAYMNAIAGLTDKLSVEICDPEGREDLPYVAVCLKNGEETGLAFHGCPGGHEFTSFILGLYNAAGPGQALDPALASRLSGITEPVKMQILVSLSCTMCPELVTAAQQLASRNKNISAEVYDINHFPALKTKYNVMSVPCLVVNSDKVTFGKKNAGQLLDILTK